MGMLAIPALGKGRQGNQEPNVHLGLFGSLSRPGLNETKSWGGGFIGEVLRV